MRLFRRPGTPVAPVSAPRTVPIPQTQPQLQPQLRPENLLPALAVAVSTEVERRNNACFAAGTLLHTGTGYKPIERFRVGDPILSRSEVDPNGELEIKVVEEVFVTTGKIVHVHVNGQIIRTTAEHPFWVDGRGWVAAKDMQAGDQLVSHDGQSVAVEQIVDTGESETVYKSANCRLPYLLRRLRRVGV